MATNSKNTLRSFEKDLIHFLKSHPYIASQNANPSVFKHADQDLITFRVKNTDPNTIFSHIWIDIKYIPQT